MYTALKADGNSLDAEFCSCATDDEALGEETTHIFDVMRGFGNLPVARDIEHTFGHEIQPRSSRVFRGIDYLEKSAKSSRVFRGIDYLANHQEQSSESRVFRGIDYLEDRKAEEEDASTRRVFRGIDYLEDRKAEEEDISPRRVFRGIDYLEDRKAVKEDVSPRRVFRGIDYLEDRKAEEEEKDLSAEWIPGTLIDGNQPEVWARFSQMLVESLPGEEDIKNVARYLACKL